jgi:very-short-patch-repair endonuclease
LFERAGAPRPAINTLIGTREGPLEVDFCWPDRRLIVEADGFEFHRTQAAFERDRRRDQLLRAAGWTPVRITWRQVNEGPEEVIAAVRAIPG